MYATSINKSPMILFTLFPLPNCWANCCRSSWRSPSDPREWLSCEMGGCSAWESPFRGYLHSHCGTLKVNYKDWKRSFYRILPLRAGVVSYCNILVLCAIISVLLFMKCPSCSPSWLVCVQTKWPIPLRFYNALVFLAFSPLLHYGQYI